MATTDARETFAAANDPLYTASDNQVSVDADTEHRLCRVIPPTSNGSGTIADHLNGKKTSFEVANGGNHKIRWNTSALRIGMTFADAATGGTIAGKTASPPWNLVGALINNIRLTFNNGGEAIFNSTGANYVHIFTANLLRFFSHDALASMSSTLFTPLPDEATTYVSASIAAGTAIGSNAQARYDKWVGAASHTKIVYKTIPFSLLFSRFPDSIIRNLGKFNLDIDWAASADLMENGQYVAATPATATRGFCHIVAADIILDSYVLSAQASVSGAIEKRRGNVDIVPFLESEVQTFTIQNGNPSVSLGQIKNFDSLVMMNPCEIIEPSGAITLQSNGQANADARYYHSIGQFLLVGNGAAAATAVVASADAALTPLSSVSIEVGGQSYPTAPINSKPGSTTTLEPSFIFHEYLKACSRLGRRELSPAITEGMFRAVLPFVMLRPWSDSAAHLSNEGKEVRLNIQGAVAGSIIKCVVYRLKVLTIRADGSLALTQ